MSPAVEGAESWWVEDKGRSTRRSNSRSFPLYPYKSILSTTHERWTPYACAYPLTVLLDALAANIFSLDLLGFAAGGADSRTELKLREWRLHEWI
jgi:hypothetical protein